MGQNHGRGRRGVVALASRALLCARGSGADAPHPPYPPSRESVRAYVPGYSGEGAQVGSYVLVHAGFAIEVVDEQFAQETIDLIRQFPELVADDLSAADVAVPTAAAAPGATATASVWAALAED